MKPEWILRCGPHRIGFRYRLENSHLPGNPDLIDELDRINPGVPVATLDKDELKAEFESNV